VAGPSGSGKSTLAKAIAGLLPGDVPGELSGELELGGRPVIDSGAETDRGPETNPGPEASTEVGILFQDPASQLVAELAEDDVAFGLENRAWPRNEMRERVPRALADVGLADFERRQSNRLSGGEQQRLALAGVEAPGPGVLVLDEPTANLDPDGADAVYERIAALARSGEATIVLVDHRADRAWPLATTVLGLAADGSPIDVGLPADVLQRSSGRLAEAGIWLPTKDAARGKPPDATADAATSSGRVLHVTEAWFSYEPGRPVVRDVNLEIAAGERVAVVGPNGSGKSTLLRLAAGALRAGAGEVRLAGRDPRRMRPAALAATVGFVPQDPELGFMAATVAEEVGLGLDPAALANARDLAARLDLPLERFGDRSPYQLSGGEQRRLSLVTAMARRPRLLLLDEPTYGQDRHGYEALVAALDELVEGGTAFLAATHDRRFAAEATDRRLSMYEGWLETDAGAGR